MIYLDEEDLIDIARRVLNTQEVIIRDLGLLASAANRPRTSVFGYDPYPTIADKAAALLVSICTNHPLQDGNKRLAFAAAWVFCDINLNRQPEMTQDAAHDLVIGVATGDLTVQDVSAALWDAGIE